jgi:hypothetical protein
MSDAPWLQTAFDRIDAANAQDPNQVEWAGDRHAKELVHAWRASHWLTRLAPQAAPSLQLALRAHHVERWRRPRADYPKDRVGYLRWRKDAQGHHAERLAELTRGLDVPDDVLQRAQALVRKQRPAPDDAEHAEQAQVYEDVLCLVFLEQQLESFAGTVSAEKLQSILAKTLPKMSAEAIGLAAALPLAEDHRELLQGLVAQLG